MDFSIRARFGLRLLIGASALASVFACPAFAQPAPRVVASATAAAPVQAPAFDARATGTAQLLAGITPATGDTVIDRLAATGAWQAHAKIMQQDWARVKQRLGEMEKWRDQELKIADPGSKTLLYPFSGPDFLNAATLFPNHKQYVFFSLESPGRLPDLASLTEVQFDRLLEHTRHAMRDIFQRNYFITDYMTKQLGTDLFKGTVPVISIMMVLEGKRIVRIEPIDLFPDLTKQYAEPGAARPHKRLSGARIEFVDAKSGLAQQLSYFSLDATDKALEYYPQFIETIGRNKPATGFLKSASYLLHDQQFKKTRDMLLASTDTIVQDDTGIPYKYFAKPGWQVKLYGQYAKPIRGLAYGDQPDLHVAYAAQAKPEPLNFPFGYHWKNGKSVLLLATRQ